MKAKITDHLKFMQLAFKESLKAGNKTLTNPLVGAVVVKGGKVIAKGFHEFFGGPHAEEAALSRAGSRAAGATLYVTLEPCSTQGKRPPCTEIIRRSRIKKVFYAFDDVNPVNRGKARKALSSFGIPCEKLQTPQRIEDHNAPFVKVMRTGIPLVILKAAVTLDGKICDFRGKSRWITSRESRTAAHHLRSRAGAVLIGSGTFNSDNPRLNVRAQTSAPFKEPIKVIISGSGRITLSHDLIRKTQKSPTLIATSERGKEYLMSITKRLLPHVIIESFPLMKGKIRLKDVLRRLAGKHHVASVLIEGGADVFSQALSEGLCDALHLFIAPRFFGAGGKALPFLSSPTKERAGLPPCHEIASAARCGPDLLVIVRRTP